MSHRTLAVAALLTAPILPLTIATAAPAHAEEPPGVVTAPPKHHPKPKAHRKAKAKRKPVRRRPVRLTPAAAKRAKVLRVAASYKGVPYAYGGASRRNVDCSGYVDLVYAEALHKRLPRTVVGLRRLARTPRTAQVGDLIFYGSPRYPYHVAIVAKVRHGRVVLTWVARHTGTRVQTQVPYAAYTVGALI